MNELDDVIAAASARISSAYFQLPIAGVKNPIYRERVYCYELYHQMRTQWPDGCVYSLGAEVDKSGHPLVRGNGLDRAKPDLLVHRPGYMPGNYAIIEIKPCNAATSKILDDAQTIGSFIDFAGYSRGICYLYGRSSDRVAARVAPRIRADVEIWIHAEPDSEAFRWR